MRTSLVIVLFLIVAPFAFAGSESGSVRAEIDALLLRLDKSGCDFYRNGEWHSAAKARAHLLRKLKANRAPTSVEEFIDRLASKSSVSGKPYLVRCDGSQPIESKVWLTQQLTQMRAPP